MGAGIMQKIRSFFILDEEAAIEEQEAREKPRWKGKLVSLSSSKNNAIVLMEPATLTDAQEAGDALKNRAAVLVNLQGLERESALRILDFISGIAYALSGITQKITDAIYLFAPAGFTVIPGAKRNAPPKDPAELFLRRG